MRNAPAIVYEREPALICWSEMIMFAERMAPPSEKPDPVVAKLAADYKINHAAVEAAPERVAQILGMLSERLIAQQSAGSK